MTPALLLALSLAAPVPADLKADRERLEQLWTDLASSDPVVRTRAVFALIDHPKAVPFLEAKAPPVKASKEQITAWLKDLNSDDERVWKAAFEELRYFDPRLALDPSKRVELVGTDNGRRLLTSVWMDQLIEFEPNTIHTTLKEKKPDHIGPRYEFNMERRGGGSGWEFNVGPVRTINTTHWQQASVAALILGRIDTRASRLALEALAAGHRDALPTRTAARLLHPDFTPFPPCELLDTGWPHLLIGDELVATRWALDLRYRPDRVRGLQGKLPPIKASKEQVTAWLKALNDDDPKVWKPAFEKLLYFRPLLAMTCEEQCESVTTDQGRFALYKLCCPYVTAPPEVFPRESTLDPAAAFEGVVFRGKFGLQAETLAAHLDGLGVYTPPHWQRARVAIVALEHVGTKDAKVVLKQLADGHPNILPTKEAKAALGRMK